MSSRVFHVVELIQAMLTVSGHLQGVLNWVGQPAAGQEPFKFEARLYSELFKSLDPSDLGDAWMEDLNPESETVIKGAYASTQLSRAQRGDRYVIK